jgi:RNA polymerase sigma-70 factor (ECF subfamily)
MEKTLHPREKKLFENYYGLLLKVAFRYAGTYEQAVEMTHHGFIKIFHEAARVKISPDARLKGAFSAWVKRIFIHTLVDKIKPELNLHILHPIPADVWQKSGNQPNSEGELIYIELIKILKGLPVTYRLVFNLYVIDGFSHAEIAKLLGITVKDSKYNLLEAKKYCNQSLPRAFDISR